ncbi:hypothetical protein MPH_01362 [Macrophomina phaseolina MS6]|uniref:Uncharacterized protein n=1 Tax=Macrophomina phaseolina (strain MS6) TaxID=1126212 RepID=K2SXS6_MACPH|nr:hypothetical protein MPH_01362 [Macrophomina phaseolina MS6]
MERDDVVAFVGEWSKLDNGLEVLGGQNDAEPLKLRILPLCCANYCPGNSSLEEDSSFVFSGIAYDPQAEQGLFDM